jgi:hypothetical protein
MHAPYRGHRIVPGQAAPLDGFTQPGGAYSFRKLRSTYAGPAVRLRRASDNAELDINFLGCTGFTGCPWDSAAAAAHCASTTCFVKTIYDQSGNARDLTQATAGSQPQLIFNCNGALPCWRATAGATSLLGPSLTPATGVLSVSAVGNRGAGTGACQFLRENGFASRLTSTAAAPTWTLAGAASGSVSASAADAAWHAGVGVINGASSVLNIDGVEVTGTTTGNTVAGTIQIVGAASTTCDEGEAIFWDPYALTLGERAALVANQRSFGWIP